MPSFGAGELTLVLVAVALVFIAGRLAPLGDALGRWLGAKKSEPGVRADGRARSSPP